MDIQRTITIHLDDDQDIRNTVSAFVAVQQKLSPVCFNNGKPMGALQLQRVAYHDMKGALNAQLTISAVRRVASAYAAAKKNRHPAEKPFQFRRHSALFLVGKRGRDASFRSDNSLSIWTTAGRKHVTFQMPAYFESLWHQAKEVDSLTIVVRKTKVIGYVTVTIEAPEPTGIHPVGIDLNETNALVAVNPEGETLFVSGRAVKVANRRTFKTRKRVARKLAARKAEHQDTHSVRRVLKRLSRKRIHRVENFARTTAQQLIAWAPANAVLVFEQFHPPQVTKKQPGNTVANRRRLTEWPRGKIRRAVQNKAEVSGIAVAEVSAAYTSQLCARCGLLGNRKRHKFVCPHCGHQAHADINAAVNIRNRYTVLRHGGPSSTGPEARSTDEGKSSAQALDS